MKFIVRLNIALVLVCVVFMAAFFAASAHLLESNARRGLSREASLMLDSAAATRRYTSEEILPLLTASLHEKFLPQSIPFYAATQNFLHLREQHPEYSYKEATLNPTNPRDHATDWEADLIQQFRDHPASHELRGERDTPMGKVMFLARPIRASAECLECHGEARAAPAALLTRYGANNGFGWQPQEVVGAQVVAVPLSGAMQDARQTLLELLAILTLALIALSLVVNVLFVRQILRPLSRISSVADRVSKGDAGAQFGRESSGELTVLSQAFERMRISLEKAMKLLAK